MKSIALTMIVKNEERCLARCLQSVKPWVDDMIVVDTGSTDRTMEIAREHGARVFQRRWTNDFSAARNAALAQSKADWNLVLDADEWLVKGQEYFEMLRSSNAPKVHLVKIDSVLGNDTLKLSTSSLIPRIIPRGVRYRGKIHEQPNHNLSYAETPLVIFHDGYHADQRGAKKGRNLHLLIEQVDRDPDNAYYQYQLGKEYESMRDHDRALSCYRLAYQKERSNIPWRHDLVLRMMSCMESRGLIQEAMLLASDEMNHWDHSADFHMIVGDVLLAQMKLHPSQGTSLLPMIEASWLKALNIGDNRKLPGNLDGRGSFIAAQKLWALYDSLKNTEKSEQYNALYQKLYQEYQDQPDSVIHA